MPGATRTAEARELTYARQYFVTVAKSYGLQAIDLVYINYKVCYNAFLKSLVLQKVYYCMINMLSIYLMLSIYYSES
jgi:hypothetical protein